MTKKRGKKKPIGKKHFVYIISILIIFSIIYLSGGGITGDYIYSYSSRTCDDSDEGRTYDVAGKVTLNTKEYYDQCDDTEHITEQSCKSSNRLDTVHAPCSIVGKTGCLAGRCIDGFVTVPLVKSDSDDGQNFNEFGYVTLIGGKEFMDFCLNNVMLREFYLNSIGNKAHVNHFCDNGCIDGACVE